MSRPLRMTHVSLNHDYHRALLEAMNGAIEPGRWHHGISLDEMTPEKLLGDSEILHIGWPEFLFNQNEISVEEFNRRSLEFLEKIGRSGVKVVWTMHNRRPHRWDEQRGTRLYQTCAQIADGIIHHTKWGMDVIRRELPFKSTAKHEVIPHGHFGQQMPRVKTREQLERQFNLPASPMRFGILGRGHAGKQIDLMVRAFRAADRADQQLVLTCIPEDPTLVHHPRIEILRRNEPMTRSEIASYNHICNALVSAHTGPTYLTSGMAADAVGAGIPMLVPAWEFFREYLGPAGIFHANTEESLAELFATITLDQIAAGKAAAEKLQPLYAWPKVAAATLELYRQVLQM